MSDAMHSGYLNHAGSESRHIIMPGMCYNKLYSKYVLTTYFKVNAMPQTISTEAGLLTHSEDVIRIGSTRVTVDSVIMAFLGGAAAEEIALQYPALDLADVYSVIGYYLRQKDKMDIYLEQRRKQADCIRKENESLFEPSGIRERLLARRSGGNR